MHSSYFAKQSRNVKKRKHSSVSLQTSKVMDAMCPGNYENTFSNEREWVSTHYCHKLLVEKDLAWAIIPVLYL